MAQLNLPGIETIEELIKKNGNAGVVEVTKKRVYIKSL